MASLSLKNIKKIYPYHKDEEKKKAKLDAKKAKKKKKGDQPEEKKVNLQITDKGVVAVQEFNLEIADKEFIVLVGPSGCGKSTTLRMIAGLEEISERELYIGDRLVNDVPPKDEIDRKVKEAAEILDITQYLGRKPKALSGGQRQRVAIGRAIVREPQVMLMDEPLSNLDAKLRNQMRAEIIKLRQRINTTFIYVTHDQTEAMTLGDRIVIMKDGEVQQIGTPQQVFNHPHNLFVATFIGTPQMNLFENAKLVKENGKYAVKIDNLTVELSADKQEALAANNVAEQDIVLGVRPEHITLENTGIEGTVDVSELMGSSVHLHVTSMGRDVVMVVSTMNMTAAEVNALSHGNGVTYNFPGHCCHVFSKETGLNLEGC